MTTTFYDRIANSTGHRPIRDELSGMVLKDESLLQELTELAFDVADNNHYKACWTLELVYEAKKEWIKDDISKLCDTLSSFSHGGAIRSISKICLFAVEQHYKNAFITPEKIQQITEASFDWLINPNGRVAAKAYAMRTLYFIGKKEDWIYPELQQILQQDFTQHSAGYKAAAKDILKKISH